jgi:hypothetical protein
MTRALACFAFVVALVLVGGVVGYRIGRHMEAEALAHPSTDTIIGVDGAGHLVSSLHWTDVSNGYSKRSFESGKYSFRVWGPLHCTEEE